MYLSPTNIQIRISGVLCIARLKSLDSIFNVAVHAWSILNELRELSWILFPLLFINADKRRIM